MYGPVEVDALIYACRHVVSLSTQACAACVSVAVKNHGTGVASSAVRRALLASPASKDADTFKFRSDF